MSSFDPTSQDRFTFGLWTVGNPGRDPFGEPVRPVLDANHIVRKLAECGASGVNLHDNDLVPFGASASERDRIVTQFQSTLKETGMTVPMATVTGSRSTMAGVMNCEASRLSTQLVSAPSAWARSVTRASSTSFSLAA